MGRATSKGNGVKSKIKHLHICRRRDSNLIGSDMWSNALPTRPRSYEETNYLSEGGVAYNEAGDSGVAIHCVGDSFNCFTDLASQHDLGGTVRTDGKLSAAGAVCVARTYNQTTPATTRARTIQGSVLGSLSVPAPLDPTAWVVVSTSKQYLLE